MRKTTFNVPKMDCASEEQLIRMKLGDVGDIKSIRFELPNRTVEVFHTGAPEPIDAALNSLNLGSNMVGSAAADDELAAPVDTAAERKLLWQVLAINGAFFVIELLVGIIAGSLGLVADSLDMLADGLVYGLALLAVGGTASRKKSVAKAGGYFQLALAAFGLLEVVRRFFGYAETPLSDLMIATSIFALIGNAFALYLLQKNKSEEAHMQASVIFTSNDVVINIGVIAAGVSVYLTRSALPDLIIGTLIFLVVARGAYRILNLSK